MAWPNGKQERFEQDVPDAWVQEVVIGMFAEAGFLPAQGMGLAAYFTPQAVGALPVAMPGQSRNTRMGREVVRFLRGFYAAGGAVSPVTKENVVHPGKFGYMVFLGRLPSATELAGDAAGAAITGATGGLVNTNAGGVTDTITGAFEKLFEGS